MRSLRFQLLAGMVGGMTVLLLAFSGALYAVIRRSLYEQFDAYLLAAGHLVSASLDYRHEQGDESGPGRDKIDLELDADMLPEFARSKHPAYFEVWGPGGEVVARSPSLGRKDLMTFSQAQQEPRFRRVRMQDDQSCRALVLRFTPQELRSGPAEAGERSAEQTLTLAVARDTEHLEDNLGFLAWLLACASAGAITLSCVVGTLVVRRGLRPVRSLAGEIAAIHEDNLTARLAAETLPREIAPIARRLNELLQRLERSFQRERRFVADVAHELRTPLAGMLSTVEVALSQPRDPQGYCAALQDCLAIIRNMQRVVANLLVLARIDARQIRLRRAPVRLRELVDSCWRLFAQRGAGRGLGYENRLEADLVCSSDPDQLAMVFSNLLDNAVEYAEAGGRIWIVGRRTDPAMVVEIANTGCRLTAEQATQVLDCFWRGDASRTDTGAHCGLGLALVQRIMRVLGGSVGVEVRPGGIFAVLVTLPAGAE